MSSSFEAARRRAAAARSAARRAATARNSMRGGMYDQEGGVFEPKHPAFPMKRATASWRSTHKYKGGKQKFAVARNHGKSKRARAQVWAGNALKTTGGLTKDKLERKLVHTDKNGREYYRIVSKKASAAAKARYEKNSSVKYALMRGQAKLRAKGVLGTGRAFGSKNSGDYGPTLAILKASRKKKVVRKKKVARKKVARKKVVRKKAASWKVDANKNRDDVRKKRASVFSSIDTNNNGSLSRKEFAAQKNRFKKFGVGAPKQSFGLAQMGFGYGL